MAARPVLLTGFALSLICLSAYTFFLHSNLPAKDGGRSSGISRGVVTSSLYASQVMSVEAIAEEELQLAARTKELTYEVEDLAQRVEVQIQRQSAAAAYMQPNLGKLPPSEKEDIAPQLGMASHTAPGRIFNPGYHGSSKPLEPRKEEDWLPLLEPTVQEPMAPEPLTIQELTRRRHLVKMAAEHSWQAYVQHAWGMDELMPLTKRGKNTFGGMGATIIDSLDTLWLLDMKDAFKAARDWVAESLVFDRAFEASVFETTIRIVGGLLSAFQLSGDTLFLHKSEELATLLMQAWETPTGIPYNTLNLRTGLGKNPSWTMRGSTLSEYGTEQMELITLTALTGNATYGNRAEHVIRLLHQNFPEKGLMPLYLHPATGKFTSQKVSMGALGDSYYEYLLKTWLLKGKTDDMYRVMWELAMDQMIESLLHESTPARYKYIAEFDRGRIKHKFDHLGCFIPAMLALGAQQGAVSEEKAQRYMSLAEDLAYTCWKMYSLQPTGLSPEFVTFAPGRDMASGVHHFLLRPEAMEAMFVMWCVTQHEKYREWAWGMFLAFEKHCKVPDGYAGVKDVRSIPCQNDNTMQSFWLAETLKYLYLIFSTPDVLPLDQWVLNTEAHPMRILKHRD